MYSKLISTVIIAGAPVLYFLYAHRELSRKIHHTSSKGCLTGAVVTNIESIASSVLAEECTMVHDTSSKSIPTARLPPIDQSTLLTKYLRHNMVRFSRFPQAWILRLLCTRSERETFNRTYLQALDFKEGDVVCGIYKVLVRRAGKIELELKPMGPVKGRLVIAIEKNGEEMTFSNETVTWKGRNETVAMPLERGIGKWTHELASWWLLESGIDYLMGLRQGS